MTASGYSARSGQAVRTHRPRTARCTPFRIKRSSGLLEPSPLLLVMTEDAGADLRAAASRLVQLLRWIFNRPAPAQPLSQQRLEGALDRDAWYLAPARLVEGGTFGGPGRHLESDVLSVVQRLLGAG